MPGQVVLSYIHPGDVSGAFMEAVLNVVDHDAAGPRHIGRRISLRSGPRIASARNSLVRTFLTTDAEWLWMLDTDMVFQPHTLDRLLDAANAKRRPIMGALCFGGARGGVVYPTIYRLRQPDEDHGPVECIRDYPPDTILQVDATGCACLLVHRSVLERIAGAARPDGTLCFPEPAPWFSESVYRQHEFGEDWSFCLRAAQLGIPVHVHTGIRIGHIKPAVVDEAAYREYQAMAEQVGGEDAVAARHRAALEGWVMGIGLRPVERLSA